MAVTQATGRSREPLMNTVSGIYTRVHIHEHERTLAYRGLVTRGAPLRLHPRYRQLVFRPTLTRSPRDCVSDENEKREILARFI